MIMGDFVSLTETDDSEEKIEESVFKALESMNFRHEKSVNSVVIKPNLCYYWDASTGYTTDPKVVRGIINWVRKTYGNDVDIRVVESDATAMRTKYAFTVLGYRKLAEEKQVELFNLSNDCLIEKTVKVNGQHIKFGIPNSLLEADLFINVPKLKIMRATQISCALKNVFGCIGYPKKIVYHSRLEEAIIGINKIVRPNLTVVDGLVALDSFPVKLGLIMASRDPFSIDWVASKILGYNPQRVGFLRLAIKEGIWSPKGVEINGGSIESLRSNFPRKSAYSFSSWTFQLKLLKVYLRLVGDTAPHFVEDL
jgi:uncharacterized protein (DUF362 family)